MGVITKFISITISTTDDIPNFQPFIFKSCVIIQNNIVKNTIIKTSQMVFHVVFLIFFFNWIWLHKYATSKHSLLFLTLHNIWVILPKVPPHFLLFLNWIWLNKYVISKQSLLFLTLPNIKRGRFWLKYIGKHKMLATGIELNLVLSPSLML